MWLHAHGVIDISADAISIAAARDGPEFDKNALVGPFTLYTKAFHIQKNSGLKSEATETLLLSSDLLGRAKEILATDVFFDFVDSSAACKRCDGCGPHLAHTAHMYAWGACGMHFVDVMRKCGLVRLHALHYAKHESPDLWASVLDFQHQHRRSVVDLSVCMALSEANSVDVVSATSNPFS